MFVLKKTVLCVSQKTGEHYFLESYWRGGDEWGTKWLANQMDEDYAKRAKGFFDRPTYSNMLTGNNTKYSVESAT